SIHCHRSNEISECCRHDIYLNVSVAELNSFPWARLKKILDAGTRASSSTYRIEADFNPLICVK
ncbi:MAG: hypothetical protein KDC59_23310, partial [Saprospiraceae bacterium]|nr:hypothetical protein [Saprospiraceae bacterium]